MIDAPPTCSYGILEQETSSTALEAVAEQVRNLGFGILDGGFSPSELEEISDEFERTRARYIREHGEAKLRALGEFHMIRAPLTHGGDAFLDLALNARLLSAINMLIPGKFILNQQNGVINPPQETYNQGAWHRDLPYQHYVSSRPLAVNALFCIDEFTPENGGTLVVPASHKSESFPSDNFVVANAMQTSAPAGSYILLDCMVFHRGGFNRTESERRAVNHVFNIPYFKQQINLPNNLDDRELSDDQKEILGFNFQEPETINAYLASRIGKGY